MDSLIQCLPTLSVKIFFLASNWNLSQLSQHEAISFCPVADSMGEEADSHLAPPSYQGVVENKKVTPEPPLLQIK